MNESINEWFKEYALQSNVVIWLRLFVAIDYRSSPHDKRLQCCYIWPRAITRHYWKSYILLWLWRRLKVELDKVDLYDLSKVTDKRVEDTVDAWRIGVREIHGTKGSLRLTETLVDETLARCKNKHQLDAGMWRYHANRMDARRSQFDLGRVDAYI